MKRYKTFKAYLQSKNEYYQTVSALKTLYNGLRSYEKYGKTSYLSTEDAVSYIELLQNSGTKLLNSYSLGTQTDGVQLITAHSSKGLEFDHVFIIDAAEELWKGRGAPRLIPTPSNVYVHTQKESDDDHLRLFFVAITRAKHHAYITIPNKTESGKECSTISYLLTNTQIEHIDMDEYDPTPSQPEPEQEKPLSFHPHIESQLQIMPRLACTVDALLQSRLENYKLSVTHLNNFLTIVGETEESRGGPQYFRDTNLLHFPMYKPDSARYGTAIHEALSLFIQNDLHALTHKDDQLTTLLALFDSRLKKQHIPKNSFEKLKHKGEISLTRYWNRSEYNLDLFSYVFEFEFAHQDVFVNDAHLSGNIDMIITNKESGAIEIVDFKTGSILPSFEKNLGQFAKIKASKYLRQLQFYKILMKHSRMYSNLSHNITCGTLEFIDALDHEPYRLSYDLHVFDENPLEELICAVWKKIIALDFPDTNSLYTNSFVSLEKFKEDLLSET